MRALAFYLPQYHRVEANDKWWGEGYTEWVATRNALPLYEGHYQPHIPLDNNYYDLLEKQTMQWQAGLMQQYGVDGLCFYHYWFSSSEQVLEKPAENLLKWEDIDMPFCFAWANESWLNKWSNREGLHWRGREDDVNSESAVIFQQKYGREEEWRRHLEYFLPFFKDKRYIRVDGRPLLIIYRLDKIPCLSAMIEYWGEILESYGMEKPFIIGTGSLFRDYGVDAIMTHEPESVERKIRPLSNSVFPVKFSYDEANEAILGGKYVAGKKVFFTAMTSYDTTPRYGSDGQVFLDATPEKFELYLSKIMAKNCAHGVDVTIINAWNEWGEGMHLEPDEENGYKWLEAVKHAKDSYKEYVDDYRINSEVYNKDEAVIELENAKTLLYFKALNNWMLLREKGRKVAAFLLRNGITSVLVYGAGVLTDHFIWECNETKISVVGIIDRNSSVIINNVPVYRIDDELPEAEAIIVTAFYHIHDIFQTIKNRNLKMEVYSLEELLLLEEE